MRRLAGIHAASYLNNWDVCTVIEDRGAEELLVPKDALSSVLKAVDRIKRLEPKSSSSKSKSKSKYDKSEPSRAKDGKGKRP